MPGPLLVDAHHVGAQQTGNETWSRNTAIELARLTTPDELRFVATPAGADAVAELTGRAPLSVSSSSLRRLALDLPRVARATRSAALLVHYTLPLTSTPGVVVIHDLTVEDPASRAWMSARTRARIRLSIRTSVHRAARIVVPTEWTREDMCRRFPAAAGRVHVAPNAVDPALREAMGRYHRRSDDDRFLALAVGTVVPRKNLGVAARALAVLRERGVDAHLLVVGPVRSGGEGVVKEIRDELGDAATFRGYATVDELARAYREADVLVFPSLHEGFGIPLIEAMAAGTPVCASVASCLPEVVGGAGLLAEPHDLEAWVDGLAKLHADRALRACLVEAGHVREQEFTWSSSAAAVLEALREAADR